MSVASQQTAPGAGVLRAQVGRWRAELWAAAPYCVRYTPAAGGLGFAFDPQIGEHAFGNDRREGFIARAGGLAWVPAGCDVYSASERGGAYLRIEGLCGPDRPVRDLTDRGAEVAAQALRRALLTGADPLQAEAPILTLAARLAAVQAAPRTAPRGWMTPQRLRRIDALIEARLEEPLLVSDLAAALGLSPGFFARAFHEATGRAPRTHILARRLNRATDLVRGTRRPLAEIAAVL
ncbi:helix-turn-helix transcriptional regulator [Rhodobacter capsulatus]|uniref:Helix-turn-helix transcriptional regulator n=1 Tax=Rhodobacter capsulatus TaxID=1061 RepID=A0A4U1JPB6_RHOCA|nr:AraC family transcriptional regulator [Rhodobacter capsulatus]TKD17840.1 helix-turn-helix transcriptional regulator [Rhodobacter capsulatus]